MTDLAPQHGESYPVFEEGLDGAAHNLYERTGENLYKRLMRTQRNCDRIGASTKSPFTEGTLTFSCSSAVTGQLLDMSAICSGSRACTSNGKAHVSRVGQHQQ
jgi:hypothetical protein